MNGLRFIGEIVLRSIFPSNLADSLVGYSDRPSTPHDPYYVSYSSSTVPDLSEVEPFPRLPCELVLRILSFSLPAPGYSTSAQRKRQLLDYALFDQDSSRWASFELRKHIHLESPESATRLLSALTDRDEEWSGVVRTLRFGQSDPEKSNITASEWMYEDAGSFIAQILIKCPNIDELWIAGAKDLQLKSLSQGTSESFRLLRYMPKARELTDSLRVRNTKALSLRNPNRSLSPTDSNSLLPPSPPTPSPQSRNLYRHNSRRSPFPLIRPES